MDNKYLNYIAKNYKDEIVLSTGMTNKNYLQKTAHLFKENKKIYMLHCVSSYPTSAINTNSNNINYIKKLSLKYKNIVPGYIARFDRSRIFFSNWSWGKNGEKHIKLKSNDWAHFDQTALDVNLNFRSL